MNQQRKTRRVGLLGGTFDPVHNGHLRIAEKASKRFGLDKVLFVPAYISPHKTGKIPTHENHRLAMLRLALEPYPGFELCELELQRKGISYTIDTLEELKKAYPDEEYYLIMGGDTFKGFPTWKDFNRIVTLCNLVVVSRPGVPMAELVQMIDAWFPYPPQAYTKKE